MSQHCKANPCCGERPCEGVPLPQHSSGLVHLNKADTPPADLREENERLERERAEQWRLRREAEASRDTERAIAAAAEARVKALEEERNHLRNVLTPCVRMLIELMEESGREIQPGEEDAFRRGEWFSYADCEAFTDAHAALKGGEAND